MNIGLARIFGQQFKEAEWRDEREQACKQRDGAEQVQNDGYGSLLSA